MLTNDQMKAGRFIRFHKARKLVKAINAHLEAGRTVQFTTYTTALRLTRKHIGMLKATKSGVYVQRGKSWDCVDGCKISVFS